MSRPSDVKAFRWLLPQEAAQWRVTTVKWWHGATLKALPKGAMIERAVGRDGWYLQLELYNGQRVMLKPLARVGEQRTFAAPVTSLHFD